MYHNSYTVDCWFTCKPIKDSKLGLCLFVSSALPPVVVVSADSTSFSISSAIFNKQKKIVFAVAVLVKKIVN